MEHQRNIVLIGMPGAGKSTVGVVLAKTLGMRFVDTDLLIQERAGRMLQEILNEDGPDAFRRIEEEAILSLRPGVQLRDGGSVVRGSDGTPEAEGDRTWRSYAEMEARLKNITTRGSSSSRAELREMLMSAYRSMSVRRYAIACRERI